MSEYNVWIAAVQSVKSLWWKKEKEQPGDTFQSLNNQGKQN